MVNVRRNKQRYQIKLNSLLYVCYVGIQLLLGYCKINQSLIIARKLLVLIIIEVIVSVI